MITIHPHPSDSTACAGALLDVPMRSVSDTFDPIVVAILTLSLFVAFGSTTWNFLDAGHDLPNQLELALVVDGEFHRVTLPKVEPSPFRERVVKRVVRRECEPKVPEVHHAWRVPYYDIEDHRCGVTFGT